MCQRSGRQEMGCAHPFHTPCLLSASTQGELKFAKCSFHTSRNVVSENQTAFFYT